MYINLFLAGVLTTIVVELLVITGISLIAYYKDTKEDK